MSTPDHDLTIDHVFGYYQVASYKRLVSSGVSNDVRAIQLTVPL